MGGSGSGNRYHWWRPSKKAVVEDCLSIDTNRWTREGVLKCKGYVAGTLTWTYRSGNSFSVNYEVRTREMDFPTVRLYYSWTWNGGGAPQSADYFLDLTTTRPRFGGLRWWFVCPLVAGGRPCRRRVGKLYLPPRGRYFACRHCHDLTYTSCQESHTGDGLLRVLARNIGCDLATAKRELRSLRRGRR